MKEYNVTDKVSASIQNNWKGQQRFDQGNYNYGLQTDLIKKMEETEGLQKIVEELKAQILELQCRNTDLERKATDVQSRDTARKSKNECDVCRELQHQLERIFEEKDSLSKTAMRLEEDVQEWKRKYISLEERRAGKEQENLTTQQIQWRGKSTGRSHPLNDGHGERTFKNEDSTTDDSKSSNGLDLASVHTDAERWQDGTLEQLRQVIAILEAKIESLENENQILQNSNAQFVKAASDDRKRYDQLRTEIKRNRSATGSLGTEYSKHENTSFVGNKQGTIQNARGFDTGRSSQAQISEQENTELKEKVAVLVLQLGELKDLQKLLIEKEKHNEELQKTVSDLRAHISTLDQEIGRLTSEIKEQKRRSDSITKQMSLNTDSGGRYENFNDEFSNSNIARRLRNLYDDEWVNINTRLGREFPQMNEFERIKKLSAVVKRCYWDSTYLANTHTQQMLMITRKESGESPYDREEVQEMLTHRRRFCQKEYVRTRVKTTVLAKVMSSTDVKHILDLDNRKAINEKLESFCNNIIDVCWLVAISHPPMVLNFNVVGRKFEGLEQSWAEFSTKKPIEDMNAYEGTIAEVVWPSVELKDGTGLYMKGDVIVVKIGIPLKYTTRQRFIGSPNNSDESNRETR